MLSWVRYLPGLVILLGFLWMHWQMGRWVLASDWARRSPARRWAVRLVACLLSALLVSSLALGILRGARVFVTSSWITWIRAGALTWALASIGLFCAFLVWRRVPRFDPSRRRLLKVTGGALLAAPAAVTGYGLLIQRRDMRVREVEVPLPGLPRDLDGLRLVQLSDIHLSPFLSEQQLAQAVDMANELRAHLALVTGDLITTRGDPLDACLRQLSRLRAEGGVIGCLGNHERYAGAETYTTEQGKRLGIQFLRNESRRLRFGEAVVNLAGVDYQRFRRPYLTDAARLVTPDSLNILLSHNSDVFPVAARQGYDLTISGHTHGGQVNFEILHPSLNIARIYTSYVYGLYRQGSSCIYVSRGIGTVFVPVRVGAPPEIALIRLSSCSKEVDSAQAEGPRHPCAT
jgi:predicted MPP superfamily phosphohydrolase